jgi:hypothetical protein
LKKEEAMPTTESSKKIKFEGHATYEIVVHGFLSANWSDRLSGLQITSSSPENDAVETTSLVGPIRDQAQLNGVLDTLYNLHLTILKVERVGD